MVGIGVRYDRGPSALVPAIRLSLRRLLLTILPAAFLAWAVGITIWGDHGLLARHQAEELVISARAELARIDNENRRLYHEMGAMEEDPVVLERMVADELGWAREGDILVRFDR